MKQHIIQQLRNALDTLIVEAKLPQDIQTNIQLDTTKDKVHGDFATNLAMVLAKSAQANPRQLAQMIIEAMPPSNKIAKAEIAGPGFINFFVANDALYAQLEQAFVDKKLNVSLPKPETIVVDYSSPNLAKEMHVGHLRSSIIGDAVVRSLEFLGHHVIRQNHVGDWGTQFGMLLAYMEELSESTQQQKNLELKDLEAFYREAKTRFDTSAEFATRSRELVVSLQSQDAYCLKLWQQFKAISLQHCQEVYQALQVQLTMNDVKGESFYHDLLPKIVAALDEKQLLVESDGAKCVFLDEFTNKEGQPLPVIIEKAGGGYLYATSDLAALHYRSMQLQADRILYFVDMRQSLHFQQVFAVAKRAQLIQPHTQPEHMGFGTMNDASGKPFKTRTGGTVKLIDLIQEAQNRAMVVIQTKNPQQTTAEITEIAHVVGIASIKYADLSKNRTSDYIFNFDHMISFDGNTAPYLLYAYTRIQSLLDKAGDDDYSNCSFTLTHKHELALGQHLTQFNDTIHKISNKGMPHLLCAYIYELATLFSRFYEACPVLNESCIQQRHSRLKLLNLTARTLKISFDILGLETVKRM
ncbi:MAG: arginine--tRNA ligase [Shewanellaceae bacterium]|nr:arginine--tRNA ligase [Shewanellaceae bacterium]